MVAMLSTVPSPDHCHHGTTQTGNLRYISHLYWHNEPVEVHPVSDLEVGFFLVLRRLLLGEENELAEKSLAVLSGTN